MIAIPLFGQPLSLAATLASGQSFRWRADADGGWSGVAGHHVWQLRVDGATLLATARPSLPDAEARRFLTRYLALDVDWLAVGAHVAERHPACADAVARFPGLRLVRQDAEETLLAFSIATASTIPRISRSISAMAQAFGKPLYDSDELLGYDFPTAHALATAPTDVLSGACNLAYRAVHLQAIAHIGILCRPGWLNRLHTVPYEEAHAELDALPHVGPKVADCVCLLGLGHGVAVPVDTHVLAISRELFAAHVPTRSLTPRTYRVIGAYWRTLFGDDAGAAQQWLFHARRADQGRVRLLP